MLSASVSHPLVETGERTKAFTNKGKSFACYSTVIVGGNPGPVKISYRILFCPHWPSAVCISWPQAGILAISNSTRFQFLQNVSFVTYNRSHTTTWSVRQLDNRCFWIVSCDPQECISCNKSCQFRSTTIGLFRSWYGYVHDAAKSYPPRLERFLFSGVCPNPLPAPPNDKIAQCETTTTNAIK